MSILARAEKNGINLTGIMRDWALFNEHGDNRVRGKCTYRNGEPIAGKDDFIISSPLEALGTDQGQTWALTRNSLYLLV